MYVSRSVLNYSKLTNCSCSWSFSYSMIFMYLHFSLSLSLSLHPSAKTAGLRTRLVSSIYVGSWLSSISYRWFGDAYAYGVTHVRKLCIVQYNIYSVRCNNIRKISNYEELLSRKTPYPPKSSYAGGAGEGIRIIRGLHSEYVHTYVQELTQNIPATFRHYYTADLCSSTARVLVRSYLRLDYQVIRCNYAEPAGPNF